MITKQVWSKLWRDESALSGVEYGILAAIVAVAVSSAAVMFKGKISRLFTRAETQIQEG